MLLERLPPPETMLQVTPESNVPSPLTVAVKLELPPEVTLFGVALATMPEILLCGGQAVRIRARVKSRPIHFLYMFHLFGFETLELDVTAF